jgi:tape measure domain-containing protein
MADQTTKTLLLKIKSETGGIKDLSTAFAEADAAAKASLDAQVKAINDVVEAKKKAAKEQAKVDADLAKQQAENFNKSMMGQLTNAPRFTPQSAIISGMSEAGRLAKQQAEESIQRSKDEVKQIAQANTLKANEQAKYAKQEIKDEQDLADKTRKITLDSLRKTIEERNAILNAASKQRLGTAIGDITSAESSDRKKLLRSLREDMTERAKLQQEEFNLVERGLQQTRTREAERARIEEAAARQRLERQAATNRQLLANETDFATRQRENQLRGMRTSSTEAFAPTPTARVSPIPRVPQDVISSHESLFARIGEINIEYRLWNAAINTVINSLRAIPKIGIELEATKSVLTAVMGTEAGMESVLKSLTKEADRTGMSLEAIRTSFRTFSASTTLAGESLESTWKMFTNMNTVITALHLSTDQANHVFLALSQIFNKSKVQSEELVKQLGNLLPGAFASFAKSMGISSMQLANAMKQGTVFAQETVETFTDFMAGRFANAFDVASQGLNANLNRMQSSFIALGEAIYGLSGGALNSAVKGITEFTNYITASVKGENEFIANTKILVDVLTGALVAGFLATIKPATMLMEALYAAATAATVLKNNLLAIGGTAVIAALTATISYARQLGIEQANLSKQAREDIQNITAEKKKADMMQPIEIRVESDPSVQIGIKKIQEYTAEYNKILQMRKEGISIYAGENGSEDIITAQTRMLEAVKAVQGKLKDTKFTVQAQIEAADAKFLQDQITHGVDLTTEIGTAHVTALEAQGKFLEAAGLKFDNTNKKSLAAAEDQIRQYNVRVKKLTEENKEGSNDVQIALAKEEIQTRTQFILDLEADRAYKIQQAKDRLDKKSESAAKKASAEKLKAAKEEINTIKQFDITAANNADNQIKLLDAQNKAKIYSFEEYVRRKKEILTKDYEAEKNFNEQQRDLAVGTGKKDLIAKYDEKLKQLKSDYESKVGTGDTKGIIDNEAAQNIDAYNTNLNMIHERYQDILGIERDSNAITSAKLELIRQQLVLESVEKGEVGEIAKQRLIELEVLKEAQNLKSKMAIYDKESATAEKIHTDAISRINQLEQVGQVSSLSATMARTKANERLLEIRQKDVDLARQALDEARPEARPAAQDKYDIAKQKLESLKLVANETGAMIEQSLGNAFEGAFNGLITKSMTARQAFASFTNSILSDIAKIIAQEMRSQLLRAIIRPLAGAALSGLGSLGQSAGVFQATNISSDDTFRGPMKPTFSSVNAKGGVYSGAGISAHSGTIVSSPTVFPFAKGVGLMGEAGPEAILPLKRNAQGKLGVVTENAGQSKGNLYNITVNVQSKQGENPEQFGQRAAAAMMRSIAKEEISSAKRPGNTLNKSRFG